MKRLLSLAFAMLLCLCLCAPAFAKGMPVNISGNMSSTAEEDPPYDLSVDGGAVKPEWVDANLELQEYDVDRTTSISRYLAIPSSASFTLESLEEPADGHEISVAIEPFENRDGAYLHTPDAPKYYLTNKGGFVSNQADLNGVKYGGRVKLTGSGSKTFTLPMDRFAADCVYRLSLECYYPEENRTITHNYYVKSVDAKPASSTEPAPAKTVTAVPTSASVQVDGVNVVFDAYNIDGSNYFKLRDLAYALNGTKNQFEVSWDGKLNAISLTSGQAYTPVGGEMSVKDASRQTAKLTNSKVLLDGGELKATAYNIGGNNYFKLRDIGEALGFNVDWNNAKQMISIITLQK